MTARGSVDGTPVPTAPAAHTVEVVRAQDGALELRHTDCKGKPWSVPVETLVAVTLLDIIHTVIEHVCVA